MPGAITLKALGLNISPNQLDVPDGSLVEASNVIIKRDNVIEARRGYKLYGDSFGTVSDRLKQLFFYKNRILRHYSNVLQWDNGSGTFTNFSESILETETGLRIKSIEANGNVYFTTSEGIKKISISSVANLPTAQITQAGGVKAIDIAASLVYTYGNHSGFFVQDSAVAYRVVWGTKDANGNLILGTPSQRTEIFNPLGELLTRDYAHLLANLDSLNSPGSMINDGNYVSTLTIPVDDSPSDLRLKLISVAEKIDKDILYANNDATITAYPPLEIKSASISGTVATITFNNNPPDASAGAKVSQYFSIGDFIYLNDFIPATGTLNGIQTITGVNDTTNTITFNTTATGAVTLSVNSTVESGRFRNITLPVVPDSPATDAELVEIQNYLDNIITNLQALTTEVEIANDTGTGVPLNINAAACSITAGTATITFSSGDPRDYVTAGSYIFLSGFTPATGTVNGLQLVASVTATTLTFTTTATGTITVAADAFINKVIVLTNALQSAYVATLDITTTADVLIQITIPDGITSDYFFQIYRSPLAIATGTTVLSDLTPSDEMQLVYEAFPTSAELSAKTVIVEDITPDVFRGANLYTNEATAEGLAQANDVPPFAKDINVFKNYVFYANTRTRQRKLTSLLGLSNINNGDKIIITDGTTTNVYTFTLGVQEIRTITTDTFANTTSSGYFTLYSANNATGYYVWMDKTGTDTDPMVPGLTGIRTVLVGLTTAVQIAQKIRDTVALYIADFSTSSNLSVVTITNVNEGTATDTIKVNLSNAWAVLTTVQGDGEDVATKKILLSSLTSPGQAVQATALSLVKVTNRTASEIISSFYLSTASSVPGQMLLEGRSLSNNPFYIMTSTAASGASFNPDIGPTFTGITNTATNPTKITWPSHGLVNGDKVIIVNSNSTPSIDGLWTVTLDPADPTNKFTIPVNVTVAGTQGSITKATSIESSENEQKINRIYYSKFQQPEAVPLVNFLDVGASDKAILRIFPLRDSLFVFKEDGLFRISGESPPWVVGLFDSSCILVASDSISVANNNIYGWTRQGISTITESGVSTLSRPIDIDILKLASTNYTNFHTATWGLGYESDNSYTVWTVNKTNDILAQIAYRYSNITQSWTTYDKTDTCGIINPADDKMYLGAGDINFVEQERKSFDRTDYADRELISAISAGNFFGKDIILADISQISNGDVIVQDQTLTVYTYNMLLKKLDSDPATDDNYFSTLKAVAGDNMRLKIEALANKLDTDSGVNDTDYFSTINTKTGSILSNSIADPTTVTTSAAHGLLTGRIVSISGVTLSNPSINNTYAIIVTGSNTFTIPVNVTTAGTGGSYTTQDNNFDDIMTSYNKIINKLNNDITVTFANYDPIMGNTIFEVVITNVQPTINKVTVNYSLDFIVGPITVYKAIHTTFTYSSQAMGDTLGLKHLREATMMFRNKAFTNAILSFSTDLLPEFEDIAFDGDGNGIFGTPNFGENFFGGGSNEAPFRTYIPRNKQRCRFINAKFAHQVAREQYAIYGLTLVGEVGLSSRAYRR